MMENDHPCKAQKTEEALPRIPKGQLLLCPKDARELCRELGHQRMCHLNAYFSCRKYRITANMTLVKATLEIPDALYRRVKAKSALAGHPVREVAIRLFSEWVEEPLPLASVSSDGPQELPPWFGVARTYASKVKRHDMASVRNSLAKERARS